LKRISRWSFAVAVAVVAAAYTSPAAFAQTFPETPAGKVMAAWLEALNSGDAEKVRAVDALYAPERDPNADLGFFNRTGGFDLLRVEKSEPLTIAVLAREKDSDTVARLELTITDGASPRFGKFDAQAIPTPSEFAPARLGEMAFGQALSRRVEALASADKFSGQVLVAHNGRILVDKVSGLANRETKAPVTSRTQFRVGSMDKMFTAVAALQLVEQGRLSLDAPVGAYLTDYPNKDIASKVTVRHLLTHTGGVGDMFGPDFMAHRLELKTHQDFVALYGARAPQFEPGTKYSYANYGFILLGAIIEKASGQSYYDYVEAHIFRPAGMTETGFLPEDQKVPNRSAGYMTENGKLVSNAATLPYRGTAAGGGYSTAHDFLKFATALQGGKLLKPETLAAATSRQTKPDLPASYGFGFAPTGADEFGFYGHNGGAPGMNGDLRIFPRSGYVVVALSNLDPPAAGRLSAFATNRLPSPK
jgi:D-alanyl-D-alanine carboxypeptidase